MNIEFYRRHINKIYLLIHREASTINLNSTVSPEAFVSFHCSVCSIYKQLLVT